MAKKNTALKLVEQLPAPIPFPAPTLVPVAPFVQHKHRPIHSVFYGHDMKVIRTNYAAHAHSAVMRSVDHMQLDRYQAKVVEVFDSETGTLHAVLRWSKQTLQVIYKRDPKEFV